MTTRNATNLARRTRTAALVLAAVPLRIEALERTYRRLFASNAASSAVKEAVVATSSRISALCPGPAS